MNQTPLPTTVQSLGRWRLDVDRAINSAGARTLTSASISNGTLRVIHGGNIVIGDGGSLDLRSGNLILGKGKIEGAALKEQFEPQLIEALTNTAPYSASSNYKTVREVSVTAPDWAQTGLIVASATARVFLTDDASSFNASMRVTVNRRVASEAGMGFIYGDASGSHFTFFSNSSFAMAPPLVDRKITVRTDIKTNLESGRANRVRTGISGIVIWTWQA